MPSRLPKHLFDALTAVRLARQFAAGLSFDGFDSNLLVRSALDFHEIGRQGGEGSRVSGGKTVHPARPDSRGRDVCPTGRIRLVCQDRQPAFDGPKVVYAAACRLGAPRLQLERIVFRQTPYALAV